MIFINRNRQGLGQFNEQDVADGLKSGRFLPDDLAWQEPMAAWQPLSSFSNLPVAGDVPPVPLAPPAVPLEAAGKIDLGLCLSEGWACFQKHWLLLALGTVVFFVLSMILQAPQNVAQNLATPLITKAAQGGEVQIAVMAGVVWLFFFAISSAVAPVLGGGFFIFFVEALRKEPVLSTIFCAFRKPAWLQILLVTFVYMLTGFVLALVVLLPGVLVSVNTRSLWPAILSLLVFFIPLIYICVVWAYSFPLIIDRRLGFWQAMELSRKTVQPQFFQVFALMVVSGVVGMTGVLLCFVGLLATAPLGYLFLAQGYRQLFGDTAPEKSEPVRGVL